MCIYHGTRQRSPENTIWTIVCRVQKPWHTAKNRGLPCAKTLAHGKHPAFAVCRAGLAHGKHGRPRHPQKFAECQQRHTAKVLSCARKTAHGKGSLCRRLVAVCPLPCAAHGKPFAVGFKGFAVCPWHTAKGRCPVVHDVGDRVEEADADAGVVEARERHGPPRRASRSHASA